MNYLFSAYMIIWAFLFCYIFFLGKKQKNLAGEIEKLKSELK